VPLDADTKAQLAQYLQLMEGDVRIRLSAGMDHISRDMKALVEELAALSPRILIERAQLERTPSFTVDRPGEDTGIVFAGVPLGHELSSLVLALLQVSGRPPKEDRKTLRRIRRLRGIYRFETFVSLSCRVCPDTVQALNLMSLMNPGVSHAMVDGAVFRAEAELRKVEAVPAVFLNGRFFGGGRMSAEEILNRLADPSRIPEPAARPCRSCRSWY